MPPPPPPPPPPSSGGPPPPPGYGGYSSYQQPYARTLPAYASFGARLGAIIVDGLVGLVFAVPAIIAIFAGPRHITSCTVDGDPGLCKVPTGGTIAIAVVLGIAGWIVFMWLYCRMVSRGQSWGQKATGVRVLDATTGEQIGAWRVFGRQFARILSGFLCYLGYLWMLWDARKQTWHDKIVGTVVVKA